MEKKKDEFYSHMVQDISCLACQNYQGDPRMVPHMQIANEREVAQDLLLVKGDGFDFGAV